MSLKKNSVVILIPRGGRLADEYIVALVTPVIKSTLFCKVYYIVGDGLLFKTAARNLGYFLKVFGVRLPFVFENVVICHKRCSLSSVWIAAVWRQAVQLPNVSQITPLVRNVSISPSLRPS